MVKLICTLLATCLPAFAQFGTFADAAFVGAANPPSTNVPVTGDILSIVTSNGWSALITVKGVATGGTYAYGLGTNRTISGSEKLVLTVTSPGFDATGATTTRTRTIYGTKAVRKPYPNQTTYNETTSGSDTVIEVALSSTIHPGETVTANVGSGLYTKTAVPNNAASGVAVSNYSPLDYPQVIGNWTWPGNIQVTNGTMRLRAVAFQKFAMSNQPVACVKFIAKDEHSHAATNTVTAMSIDNTLSDSAPFGEYVADLNVSTFTALDRITCDFIAYPWVGTNPLYTASTGFTFPTAYPAPLTNTMDVALTYGITRARVRTDGNDATGVAAVESYWATNTTPQAFATIGRALVAIYNTNSAARSRANIGGGKVLLGVGSHNWLGSSVSLANGNNVWCTIEPDAGVTRDQAIIAAYGTDERGKDDGDMLRLYNLTINTSTSLFYRQHIWMDQCNVNATGATLYQTSTGVNCWYLTDNNITNITQGIVSYNGQKLVPALVRGNYLPNYRTRMAVYTTVGNYKPATDIGSTNSIQWDASGQAWPLSCYGILYNNIIKGMGATGNILAGPGNFSQTNGYAIVQNLFEKGTNSTGVVAYDTGSHNSYNFTNAIIWLNHFGNTKSFVAYNDQGSAAAWRVNWSVKGNYFTDYNLKSDTFTSDQNGARVGGWMVMYGVDSEGNVTADESGSGAPDSFMNEDTTGIYNNGFEGLRSFSFYHDVQSYASTNNWAQFTTPPNYTTSVESVTTDYHLQAGSPLLNLQTKLAILPFDIGGSSRSLTNPPGVYIYP